MYNIELWATFTTAAFLGVPVVVTITCLLKMYSSGVSTNWMLWIQLVLLGHSIWRDTRLQKKCKFKLKVKTIKINSSQNIQAANLLSRESTESKLRYAGQETA